MSEATVEELVEAAKKPGTFSIINALKDRAYPRDDIEVYLNEDAAFKASVVSDEIDALKDTLTRKKGEAAEEIQVKIDALVEKRSEIFEELRNSKFTFIAQGISEGKREELLEMAIAKFPIKYEEKINELTGETYKDEIQDVERDKLFTSLLWLEHLKSVEAPDGSIQDSFTIEDINELRSSLPIAASTSINERMEKLRTASAIFMMTVNEDFLAKR